MHMHIVYATNTDNGIAGPGWASSRTGLK